MIYTVETGLITSIVALLEMLVYPINPFENYHYLL
jgi:hypothetical protein